MTNASARLSLGFSCVGHTYSHLLTLLFPTVVLALEKEMGLPYDELIALALAGNLLFGAAALPAGWLGDRFGPAWLMVIFFVGTGAATILTGLVDTPLGIAAGLALTGLFGAIYHPVGIAWLVQNAENRGRSLGVNGVFGSIGVAAAPVVAGALTDFAGWRMAFIVPGVVCLATGLVLWVYVRGGSVMQSRTDRKPEPPASRDDVIRAFLVLSVTMLAAGLIYTALIVAMPKIYAERMHGLVGDGATGAGILVSLVFLSASGAQILGGWFADRYKLKYVYIVCFAIQMPLFLFAASATNLPLFAATSFAIMMTSASIPAESGMLARYTPVGWRSTAFGAKFVLSLGVSALAVPLISVIYGATGGFFWLFVALAMFSLTIVVFGLLLPGGEAERAPQPAPATGDD